MSALPSDTVSVARSVWWAFLPYVLVSGVHVAALAGTSDAIAASTKLLLMPALAFALLWGGWRLHPRTVVPLLSAAVLFSWLGDGAGTFFAFAPTLPLMLAFFGLAHLLYIWAFWRHLALRRLPWWSLVFLAWWVVLLIVLWPLLGGLSFAVAGYGLVLGGTASLASRCHPLVVYGGILFLASDTILAFRLFAPELMPDWTSPAVMLTYTLGQGLIIAGALVTLRDRQSPSGLGDRG